MEAKQIRAKLRKLVLQIGELNDCEYKTVSNSVLKDCEEFNRSGKNPKWNKVKVKKITSLTEILKSCSSIIGSRAQITYNNIYPYKPDYNGMYYPYATGFSSYVPYKQTYMGTSYQYPDVNFHGQRIIRMPRQKRKAKGKALTRKRSNDESDDERTAKRVRVSFSPDGTNANDPIVLGGRENALLSNLSDKDLKTAEVYLSLDSSNAAVRVRSIAFVHESASTSSVKLSVFHINENDSEKNKAFFYYCVSEIAKKISKGKHKYQNIITKAASYEEDFRKIEYKSSWNDEEYEIKLNNKTVKNMEKVLSNKLNDDDQ